jgi:hypothetical protein
VGSDKLLEVVCCEIWQNGAQFQAKTDLMRLLNPTPPGVKRGEGRGERGEVIVFMD